MLMPSMWSRCQALALNENFKSSSFILKSRYTRKGSYEYTLYSTEGALINTEGALSIAQPGDFHPTHPVSLIAFDATSASDGIILFNLNFKFCPVIIASMPNRDHRGKRVCG